MLDASYSAGARRAYRRGSATDSSMRVYLYPSSGTTEIGTINTSGTTVTSATFSTSSSTRTVSVKLTTGTGKVPSGTCTNTFQFQLYTGSLIAGSGTLQSGAVGNVNVSVTSTTSNTFSLSLGSSSLDFGSALMADSSYSASTTMTVTAPSNFSISAKSGNLGYLLCPSGESFPYHLYFSGSATESILTNGLVTLITSSSAVTGVAYGLSFKTDTLGLLAAGDYADRLTLMFTT